MSVKACMALAGASCFVGVVGVKASADNRNQSSSVGSDDHEVLKLSNRFVAALEKQCNLPSEVFKHISSFVWQDYDGWFGPLEDFCRFRNKTELAGAVVSKLMAICERDDTNRIRWKNTLNAIYSFTALVKHENNYFQEFKMLFDRIDALESALNKFTRQGELLKQFLRATQAGRDVLWITVRMDDPSVFQLALERGADVNFVHPSQFRGSLLNQLCSVDPIMVERIRMILASGYVNMDACPGWTPRECLLEQLGTYKALLQEIGPPEEEFTNLLQEEIKGCEEALVMLDAYSLKGVAAKAAAAAFAARMRSLCHEPTVVASVEFVKQKKWWKAKKYGVFFKRKLLKNKIKPM